MRTAVGLYCVLYVLELSLIESFIVRLAVSRGLGAAGGT